MTAKPSSESWVRGIESELLELASELIERKTAPFDPAAFKDSYRDALRELIERKRKQRAVISDTKRGEEPRRSAEVVDLMEALKKSVSSEKSGSGRKKPAAKSSGGSSNKGKSTSKGSSRSSSGRSSKKAS